MRFLSIVLIAVCAPSAVAENAILDRFGRLSSMIFDGEELAVRGKLEIPSSDWSRITDAVTARRSGESGWQGTITPEAGKAVRFNQTITEEGGRVWITVEATADAKIDAAGIYYTVDVPRELFAGGVAAIQGASGPRTSALPLVKPEAREFLTGDGSGFVLSGSRNLKLTAELDAPHRVALQDRWDRSGRTFAALVELHTGPLEPGQKASLKLGLTLAGDADHTPVHLWVNPSARRYQFQGIGGNYCFNI
jgi:hypothetical protein